MTENIVTTGRRKTSVARAFLKLGDGKITINNLPLDKFFINDLKAKKTLEPLFLTDSINRFDIKVLVYGGGITGQYGAITLAVARALVKYDETMKAILRKHGLLTRDARMVERKKYGLKKARKRFQFSKR